MQPGQKHPKPSAVGGAQQCYATAVWLTAQYKDDRCKEGGQGGLGIYFESIRPHDMISGADATLWISLECDPCLMFNCGHEVNFEQIYSAVPFSVLQPGRVYNKYRYFVFYSILKIKAKLADFACLTSSMSCSLSACLMSCSVSACLISCSCLGVHLTLLNENEMTSNCSSLKYVVYVHLQL